MRKKIAYSLAMSVFLGGAYGVSAQGVEYQNQHGLALVNAAEAYQLGFTGKGVVIGVVDSGLDTDHSEFYGRLLPGYDFITDQAILPQSGNTDWQIEEDGSREETLHGTHVSGIIAANKDGKGIHGVAYDSQLFMVKYKSDAETGEPFLAESFARVADLGAKVVNLSLGLNDCDADPSAEFCNVTDYTAEKVKTKTLEASGLSGLQSLHDKGVLAVISTGNESQPHADVLAGMPHLFPELESTIVAVTSVNKYGEISNFSNRCGVAANWCLSAPGGDGREGAEELIASTVPGGYDFEAGTSMAAPHVTGVAALVAEAFPYFTANNLQQTLLTTATPLGDREVYGWGLVNAVKAVKGPAQFIHQFEANTQGQDSVFSNDISGNGRLIKSGLGRLELSGNNQFHVAQVVGGELAITGSHEYLVQNDQAGRLSGDGRIGEVITTGVVAPGVAEHNPLGQLHVTKSFVATDTSVLELTTTPDGQSSSLVVEGASQIDGMNVVLTGDLFRPEVSYIVMSSNQLQGQVGEVTAGSGVFLTGSVAQTAKQLKVDIQRNEVAFDQFVQTKNQRAVAQALDRHSVGQVTGLQPLYDLILNSNGSDLATMTQQLSGEVYSSTQTALVKSDRRWAQRLIQQSRSMQQVNGLPVWAEVFTTHDKLGGKGGVSNAKFRQSGVAIGAEWALNDQWSLGAATAYQDGKLTINELSEQAKSKSYSAAVYARTQWPMVEGQSQLNWLVGMSASRHNLRYKRTLSAVDVQRLSAKSHNTSYQLFSELGWQMSMNDQWTIEPFLGAGWLHNRDNALTEHGGYAALQRGAKNTNTGYAQLGVRNRYEWDLLSGRTGSIYADLAWQHSFGRQQPTTDLRFAANQAIGFSSSGVELHKNSLLVGLGAGLSLTKSSQLSLAYQGVFSGSGSRQHGGILRLEHRF